MATKTAQRPQGDAPTGARATKTIDKMLADIDDWRGDVLADLRGLIHDADPEVVEGWKWMGSPVWSNHGNYAVGNAHKNKVKLTFPQGAHLKDPKKLFNNGFKGKHWRAIDLHEGDTVDKTAFKRLVREAVRYNQDQEDD